MANESKYNWTFCTIGGVTRVRITNGQDIAHLDELDEKLWTVLSCPVKGLEFDEKTLKLIDKDNDGKIRVNEVKDAAKWLTSVLKNPDTLLKEADELALSDINEENENGAKLLSSAKQILSNLGLEKDSISVADTSDSVAIFAKTQFNGDGIITPASADDEALKTLIENAVATVGGTADRSGVDGVNADQVEAFYAACKDYADWKAAGTPEILPYGDNTEAALAACEAIKDKVADYFMRCKLSSFAKDATSALDVSVEKIGAISGNNLATAGEEIATYPLARVDGKQELPFEGINPAWQAAFATFKALVLDVDFKDKTAITEAEWNETIAKFAGYTAWKGAKKGDAVESLGLERIEAILKEDKKAALLELIDKDKALEAEATSIDEVCKLAILNKNFYKLLKNFVTFDDFYASPDGVTKAVFQAGRLYIDQRSTDLCIRVEDMGKHGDMAGLSGMFILYCACTSKVKAATMNIAAVLTSGSIANLRVGQNAVFYDRDGLDWDATITKIVDNPISVGQAFWSPYRKFANTITERMTKNIAEKEAKVSGDMTSKAGAINLPANKEEAAAAGKAANTPAAGFDIAKFAGIFAAFGMAAAFLGTALAKIFEHWYTPIIILVALVVCISGPSMIMAWLKIKKRNLGPVLNANGWAINSKVLVNTTFGSTFTKKANLPKVAMKDPYADKKTPCIVKILYAIILLAAIGAGLYFTDNLKCVGLPYHKEVPAEVVEDTAEAAPAAEDAPVETPAEEAAE